ncbi:MAG: hypothetical protein NMNS01_15700 [Nitrosomonas sp.]|nr:MAG: hypothetical protein NMNS01_15700 [Nitrosomonas sp.]
MKKKSIKSLNELNVAEKNGNALLVASGHVIYPFSIEMNLNHGYWHFRNNDFSAEPISDNPSKTCVNIKFSFANCLDDFNGIFSHANDDYTPNVRFERFSTLDDLLQSRIPALAG